MCDDGECVLWLQIEFERFWLGLFLLATLLILVKIFQLFGFNL
jgi:hypothetical protein